MNEWYLVNDTLQLPECSFCAANLTDSLSELYSFLGSFSGDEVTVGAINKQEEGGRGRRIRKRGRRGRGRRRRRQRREV